MILLGILSALLSCSSEAQAATLGRVTCLTHACFPPRVPLETLISIYSAEVQYKVIRSNHLHRNRIHEYCTRCKWFSSLGSMHLGELSSKERFSFSHPAVPSLPGTCGEKTYSAYAPAWTSRHA